QQPAAYGVAFEWDPTNQLLTAGRLTSSTTPAVQIGQFPTLGSSGAVKIAGLYALYSDGGDLYSVPGGATSKIILGKQQSFKIDHNGHTGIVAYGTPAISSCGTSPTLTSGSSDNTGSVTIGSGVTTSCTITFGVAFAAA